VRVVVRPVANPLPLGIFALGIGSLLLSLLQVGAIGQDETRTVAVFVLAAVFPVQLIAALVAVLARDTPGFNLLALLSGSWLALGVNLLVSPPGSRSTSVGAFLLGIGAALLMLGTVAVLGKRSLGMLIAVAAVRYVLFGLYELTGSQALQTASGVVGLVLVGACVYTGLALLLEEAKQRTVLPLLRTGTSRESIEGGSEEQLGRLRHEPGVRAQL